MIDQNRFILYLSKKQCVEFALISILLTLIPGVYRNDIYLAKVATILTLTTILLPIAFYPFALLWFNLARAMSLIGPIIVLSIVFFLIVTPMGLLRKLIGRDSLRRKEFKRNRESVMVERNYLYSAKDFLHMV